MTEALQKLKRELENLSEEKQERVILYGINRLQTKEVWDNMPKETHKDFIEIAKEAKESIRKRQEEKGNED
jgi:TRAP-type C4-dicarboxylate transport system substrate-binding protein